MSQEYFKRNFGLVNDDNTINIHRSNEVSSNVVSVLQGGAFFGALGSANVSCECLLIWNEDSFHRDDSAKLGRKMTLIVFTVIFSIGAVCNLIHLSRAVTSPYG